MPAELGGDRVDEERHVVGDDLDDACAPATSRRSRRRGEDAHVRRALRAVGGELPVRQGVAAHVLGRPARRGPRRRRAGSSGARKAREADRRSAASRRRLRGAVEQLALGPFESRVRVRHARRHRRRRPPWIPAARFAAHVVGGRSRTLAPPRLASVPGLTGASAAPRAAGSSAGRAGCAGTAHRCEPPVPDLVPICRSTIVTCRDRHIAAFASWSSSRSASSHTSPYVVRSRGDDQQRPDQRRSSSSASSPARRTTCRKASHRDGSSSRRSSRSRSSSVSPRNRSR